MKYDEAKLYLEHTSYNDFNLEEHQINNRLEAIKVVLEENERLKRQLEELMKTNNVLTQELMKDSDIKQDYLTTCCGIPIGDIPSLKYENDRYKRLGFKHLNDENNKLINQQKEFIKYLEEEILKNTPKARWKHYNEDGFNDYDVENGYYIENQPVNVTLKEILSKYKEIIGGVEDEK